MAQTLWNVIVGIKGEIVNNVDKQQSHSMWVMCEVKYNLLGI